MEENNILKNCTGNEEAIQFIHTVHLYVYKDTKGVLMGTKGY